MALAPCPACRRHVDVSGDSCPFCGAACVGLVAKGSPIVRMSRSALALASSLAIVGCGGDDGGVIALYGVPPDDAAAEVQDDGGLSTDSSAPDTSADSAAESTADAADDSASDVQDTGGPLPPYGLPPSDGG